MNASRRRGESTAHRRNPALKRAFSELDGESKAPQATAQQTSATVTTASDTRKKRAAIRVACRVRPLIEALDLIAATDTDSYLKYRDRLGTCISLCEQTREIEFGIVKGSVIESERFGKFDALFNAMHATEQVFESEVVPLIEEGVLQGYNTSLLLYGPTGSGKTHSAVGSDIEPGLIPLSVTHLLSKTTCASHHPDGSIVCSSSLPLSSSMTESDSSRSSIHISALEVYNEKVYDLASRQCNELRIFTDSRNRTTVKDLTQTRLRNWSDFQAWFKRVNERRKQAHTQLNAHSSRSHLVLKLTLRFRIHDDSRVHSSNRNSDYDDDYESQSSLMQPKKRRLSNVVQSGCVDRSSSKKQRNQHKNYNNNKRMVFSRVSRPSKSRLSSDEWKIGTLTIVDLAGSENANKSSGFGSNSNSRGGKSSSSLCSSKPSSSSLSRRGAESGAINNSLFVLSSVIEALQSRKKKSITRIPYRNSKLTRLLTDCLGGNSISSLICCLSPSIKHAWQTRHALSFATNTRTIENRISQNIEQHSLPQAKKSNEMVANHKRMVFSRVTSASSKSSCIENDLKIAESKDENETEECDEMITTTKVKSKSPSVPLQTPSKLNSAPNKKNVAVQPTPVPPSSVKLDRFGLPPPLTPASNRTIIKLYLRQAKQLNAQERWMEAKRMYEFIIASFCDHGESMDDTRIKIQSKIDKLEQKIAELGIGQSKELVSLDQGAVMIESDSLMMEEEHRDGGDLSTIAECKNESDSSFVASQLGSSTIGVLTDSIMESPPKHETTRMNQRSTMKKTNSIRPTRQRRSLLSGIIHSDDDGMLVSPKILSSFDTTLRTRVRTVDSSKRGCKFIQRNSTQSIQLDSSDEDVRHMDSVNDDDDDGQNECDINGRNIVNLKGKRTLKQRRRIDRISFSADAPLFDSSFMDISDIQPSPMKKMRSKSIRRRSSSVQCSSNLAFARDKKSLENPITKKTMVKPARKRRRVIRKFKSKDRTNEEEKSSAMPEREKKSEQSSEDEKNSEQSSDKSELSGEEKLLNLINSADMVTLQKLSQIGKKRAELLQRKRPFSDLSEVWDCLNLRSRRKDMVLSRNLELIHHNLI